MKNKFQLISIIVVSLVLSGCVGLMDSNGWSFSQKNEFIHILKTDKYLSICENKVLAQEIVSSKNTQQLTKMLVSYTNNLANSCINLKMFDSVQRQRKGNKVETYYGRYLQEVNTQDIQRKLRAGLSIEAILAPYVPKNEQFMKLVNAYHSFASFNTLTANKLHTLRVNIERVKLMNDNLGQDYILVNIPEYVVRVKNGNRTNLKFKVVVGRQHLQTPVFAEKLKYITLNPQWSVPDSIARNEVIPGLLKNSNYLKRHRMVARKTYDLNSPVMHPSRAELKLYRGGKGAVPFKFIEVPSNSNALGRVKFIFPNKHSVYMHDTQMKKLFNRPVRCFSHGCVRLEKPRDLLSYVTTHYTANTLAEVNTKYKSMKTHYLKIIKDVMVHTAYMTAYIAEDNKLRFFDDIYLFDKYQRLTF